MPTEIRKTAPCDLPAVMSLFDRARSTMAALGIDQWQNGYPFRADIERDIAAGESYVVEKDGAIVATFMLMERPEPSYATIEGAWRNAPECPYAAVHRITVSPEHRLSRQSEATEKPLSALIMDFAKEKAKADGFTGGIRIDTHEGNIPMRRMLEKQGFVYCGVIRLHCPGQAEDGHARVAYQYLP